MLEAGSLHRSTLFGAVGMAVLELPLVSGFETEFKSDSWLEPEWDPLDLCEVSPV